MGDNLKMSYLVTRTEDSKKITVTLWKDNEVFIEQNFTTTPIGRRRSIKVAELLRVNWCH